MWINLVLYAIYVCTRIFDSPKLMAFCVALIVLCLLDELFIIFFKKNELNKQEKKECTGEIIGNILIIAAFIAKLFEAGFVERLFA